MLTIAYRRHYHGKPDPDAAPPARLIALAERDRDMLHPERRQTYYADDAGAGALSRTPRGSVYWEITYTPGPDPEPEPVIPGLESVRTAAATLPPVAPLPPAPDRFELTPPALARSDYQADLFAGALACQDELTPDELDELERDILRGKYPR